VTPLSAAVRALLLRLGSFSSIVARHVGLTELLDLLIGQLQIEAD
jgi:hypothetical protein